MLNKRVVKVIYMYKASFHHAHTCTHTNTLKHRIYVAYTTFYLLGLIMSMQIPFVGFQPIGTSEHMAAGGLLVTLVVQLVSKGHCTNTRFLDL